MLSKNLRRRDVRAQEPTALSYTDWAKMFAPGSGVTFNGQHYATVTNQASTGAAYDNNAVVYSCAANRLLLFSEARFQYQQLRNGRPGDLFGTPDLGILEEPWPGASTRDLLVQVELDVLQAGNSYWVRQDDSLIRLDPAKVKVLVQQVGQDTTAIPVGERVLGYAVMIDHDRTAIYPPDLVAHYKPHPDRNNRFIGMSWLSPCLEDIDADSALTTHKRVSVQTGANLNYVVTMPPTVTGPQFEAVVNFYRANYEGADNSGRTLFLANGADVRTVGQTFENLALKATQGAGETRIAACAGVPPVIVGLSEGLDAATYSNYAQARRRLVDGTMRPLWGFFTSSFQSLINVPSGARLWYDDRDIPFLREDVTDQATIMSTDAITIQALVSAGFVPDAVIDAVVAKDLKRLQGNHTGLYSVQLQPPNTGPPAEPPALPSGKPAALPPGKPGK